jgi:uncharacterized membrane protein YdjX (TVP38/TMEM64 family)
MRLTGKTKATTEKNQWVLPALLITLLLASGAGLWYSGLLQHIEDRQRLIASLRDSGLKGPLFCIVVQFVQVVIFFIPGEITQFAAGYVFGTWAGLAYSVVGIMLGSGFNFYFARVVGRPALERIIKPTTIEKVDRLLNNAKGKSAMFLLFLLPGMPKDALCYGAGLSKLSILELMVVSGLGRIPALLFSIHLGAQTAHGDFLSMTMMGSLVVVAIVAYYLYERYQSGRERAGSKPPR